MALDQVRALERLELQLDRHDERAADQAAAITERLDRLSGSIDHLGTAVRDLGSRRGWGLLRDPAVVLWLIFVWLAAGPEGLRAVSALLAFARGG